MMRSIRVPLLRMQRARHVVSRHQTQRDSSSRYAILGTAAALSATGTLLWSLDWFSYQQEKASPHRIHDNNNHDSMLLAVSSSTTASRAPISSLFASRDVVSKDPKRYDFIIIGHGNAGQSAMNILRRNCPHAKIGVVDPLRFASFTAGNAANDTQIDFLPHSALSFQPSRKSVSLGNGQELRYRHGILIATGSRGSPPPMSLLDPNSLDRILELRPTECFPDTYKRVNEQSRVKRPVLSPHVVRQLAFLASSQRATVGILGSGWEAVELAVSTARAGGRSLLTFGSAGPLSNILPRYLSAAVSRRLEKEAGIRIQERSLVRYVAHHMIESMDRPRLELHTAKSYDLMDTQRTPIDLLIVAPRVDGPRGTAVLPSDIPPNSIVASGYNQPWYQSWSQLSCREDQNNAIVCFADDGRISVNAELCAASRVYAAGSVAKYPSSLTGHAHVAGEGSIDGALAGKVAALHMSREYHERTHGPSADDDFVQDSDISFNAFPIWRSDRISYLSDQEGPETTALASVGIRALLVGHCDSERMATHGFWWTNHAVHRRLTRKLTREAETAAPGEMSRKRTRRKTKRSKNLPVYGTGVVFYLDRSGKICGIMTWGLPYTVQLKGDDAVLNADLVDRLKQVISSNGMCISSDKALQSSDLASEGSNIVSIARVSSRITERPLYRYTAAKPPSIASIGMLKRKEQTASGELLGENLYVTNDHNVEASSRPQSLVYVHPMGDNGHNRLLPATSDAEQTQRAWEDNDFRARPPKEEPLWLRRGDARRMMNYRQVMGEIAEANIRAGKFSDGKDAVQQAKVPMVVQNVKAWMDGKSDSDDSEERCRDEDQDA